MPLSPSRQQAPLFVLRLWRETLDATRHEWRGEVKNTSTGEVRYFRSAASLYADLLAMIEPDEPGPHTTDAPQAP